ncbi:hypothetical protein ACFVH4_15660 [Nocardia ignorata]|uniref:hypothetical protein n=1 Tax=Nocardia ignorata TaxID=145285 RepID=UPI003637BC28
MDELDASELTLDAIEAMVDPLCPPHPFTAFQVTQILGTLDPYRLLTIASAGTRQAADRRATAPCHRDESRG